MLKKNKLIRITTVPMALAYPLSGQPSFMHKNGFDVIMISANGKELPKVLSNEICPHIVIPMTRRITPWQDLWSLFRLIKFIKKEKPDIVHTETPKAGLLGMLASRICNVNIRIHTVAGLPLMVENGFKLWLLKLVEKITYAAATNVWPNSYSLKEFILKHNFTSSQKIHVIGKGSSNGINTERFNVEHLNPEVLEEVKKSFCYDGNCLYFLFVGRMVFDKGIIELVNTFIKLQNIHSNLRLILLGNYEKLLDPLPEKIESEIKTNPYIIHINWTNHVEYYMAVSDYFIFPSYREGFPNVLLEAAAMQLPIICSNIAGNIDIVTNDKTGVIFESQNENSLEEAMIKSMQTPQKSIQMASCLHKLVTNSFEREIFWKSMLLEYRNLIN